MLGQDQPGYARRIRRPEDRAEIVRIGDSIEHHQERRPLDIEEILDIDDRKRSGFGENPLSGLGIGERIERAFSDLANRYPLILGQDDDVFEDVGGIASRLHDDLSHRAGSSNQEFADGLATFHAIATWALVSTTLAGRARWAVFTTVVTLRR